MREPFSINPMLAEHIAPLTEEEFRLLEESLLAEGCRDPLVVWKEENVLVDGHNRKAICDKHGLTYSVVYRSFPGLKTAKAWMDLNQLGRRNLTKEQRNELIKRLAVGGVRQKDIAEKVGLSKQTVSDIVHESGNRTANDFTNPTPPDLTVTQKLKEEKDRLQKDLNKALEMATAAETKAAELYKAREEAERLKAELEAERKKKLEVVEKTVEVEKIVEKQVAVEDPATAFRLKKAEEQRDKYEMELKKIQQEGRDWRRLEDKKSKLENEITKLTMRASEKRTEMTLMTAIENVEHSRYISDRIHDMCQRGEMTMEQLDEAERVMNAMVAAGKNCLAVIQGERAGLVKAKGGLRVVE